MAGAHRPRCVRRTLRQDEAPPATSTASTESLSYYNFRCRCHLPPAVCLNAPCIAWQSSSNTMQRLGGNPLPACQHGPKAQALPLCSPKQTLAL